MATKYKFVFLGAGPTTISMLHNVLQIVDRKEVVVVDSQDPFEQFTGSAGKIGMQEMRSGWDLSVFGRRDGILPDFAAMMGMKAANYRRPPVWLVRLHSQGVYQAMGVRQLKTRAKSIARTGDGWQVQLADGTVLETSHVVAALGMEPHRQKPFTHTLQPQNQVLQTSGEAAVIGAGMSAGHTAQALVALGMKVTLFGPRGYVNSDQDASDKWFAKCQGCDCKDAEGIFGRFQRESLDARIKILKENPLSGSMNNDMVTDLKKAEPVRMEQSRVKTVAQQEAGKLFVITDDDRAFGPFKAVYDARGYRLHVDNLAGTIAGLREAIGDNHKNGLPLVSPDTMEVAPGLILPGYPALIELGPLAHTFLGGVTAGQTVKRAIERGKLK